MYSVTSEAAATCLFRAAPPRPRGPTLAGQRWFRRAGRQQAAEPTPQPAAPAPPQPTCRKRPPTTAPAAADNSRSRNAGAADPSASDNSQRSGRRLPTGFRRQRRTPTPTRPAARQAKSGGSKSGDSKINRKIVFRRHASPVRRPIRPPRRSRTPDGDKRHRERDRRRHRRDRRPADSAAAPLHRQCHRAACDCRGCDRRQHVGHRRSGRCIGADRQLIGARHDHRRDGRCCHR